MKPKKNRDLRVRTLINGVSAIIIAFFIFLANLGPLRWIFTAAVAAIAATAMWEYTQLLKKKGLTPAFTLSITAAVLYVFAVFIKTQGPHTYFASFWQQAPEIVLALSFFGCFVYYAWIGKPAMNHIASTFLGIIYIGVPLGLVVRIMYFFTFGGMEDFQAQGSWWIIYLIAVTKSSDIGGYFVGTQFGKRKLASSLSPNKTLEGALGGLVVSALVSILMCYLGKNWGHTFSEFTYFQAVWLGLVVGALGQTGDLAESLIKRDAGVKDSNKIPGVGGVLDMVDSLLFTAPVVYIFLRIVYTQPT